MRSLKKSDAFHNHNIKHELFLARHGQTDFNIDSKIQDPDTPILTEEGKEHARLLGTYLHTLAPFDQIFCSDQTRNIQTLGIAYPDYKSNNTIKIDPRLRKRLHGDLVGKSKQDIQNRYPFEGRLSWHLYFEGTDMSVLTPQRFSGTESLANIQERIHSLIRDALAYNRVLLLGSSVINHYILEWLQFETIGRNKPKDPETDQNLDFQSNDEVRTVNIDNDRIVYSSESLG